MSDAISEFYEVNGEWEDWEDYLWGDADDDLHEAETVKPENTKPIKLEEVKTSSKRKKSEKISLEEVKTIKRGISHDEKDKRALAVLRKAHQAVDQIREKKAVDVNLIEAMMNVRKEKRAEIQAEVAMRRKAQQQEIERIKKAKEEKRLAEKYQNSPVKDEVGSW